MRHLFRRKICGREAQYDLTLVEQGSIVHAKRRQNTVRQNLLEGLTGDGFDDPAKNDVIRVAVAEDLPGGLCSLPL
jgi:hypothetical protein